MALGSTLSETLSTFAASSHFRKRLSLSLEEERGDRSRARASMSALLLIPLTGGEFARAPQTSSRASERSPAPEF